MLESKIYGKEYFHRERHSNGQLALVLDDDEGERLEELSIAHDAVRLGHDEIILKDFSEDLELTEDLNNSGIITQTDRFVLIDSHICPICKLLI